MGNCAVLCGCMGNFGFLWGIMGLGNFRKLCGIMGIYGVVGLHGFVWGFMVNYGELGGLHWLVLVLVLVSRLLQTAAVYMGNYGVLWGIMGMGNYGELWGIVGFYGELWVWEIVGNYGKSLGCMGLYGELWGGMGN